MKYTKILAATVILTAMVSSKAYATDIEMYKIKTGETLWDISNRYDSDINSLLEANPHIKNPNDIIAGDEIKIYLDKSDIKNKTPQPQNMDKNVIPDKTNPNGAGAEAGADKNNLAPVIGAATTEKESDGKDAKRPIVNTPGNPNELRVAELVNVERQKNNLPPLTFSADISNIARVKSEDMAKKKYFSHTSQTYGSPFDMLKSFGIKYKTAGENIAKGQKTPENVMKSWMNSASHRKNILNPKYTEIGVGYATDASGTPYWTQLFLSR